MHLAAWHKKIASSLGKQRMDLRQAFGLALREQRKKTRISQDALALLADLDRTYISLLERGTKSPTLDTIQRLCAALQIPASQLILSAEELRARSRRDRPDLAS